MASKSGNLASPGAMDVVEDDVRCGAQHASVRCIPTLFFVLASCRTILYAKYA
jgi:hypothetical protein